MPGGVLCLAVSLLLKPHDAALVWLYLLLAGGLYRRRALQTLLVVAAVSLPLVLWVAHIAPGWIHELQSNLATVTSHGHSDDPGPASMSTAGIGMIVSLQSVFSTFQDDPHFYYPITYLLCAAFLLLWSFTTLRTRLTPAMTWLALAAISSLSMLPVYHRLYDTRMLLLTIPACAMLWAEGGLIGRLALALNTTAILADSRSP